MNLTFAEYSLFGYSLIPETEFERYATRAYLTAHKYTFGRIDGVETTDIHKRGLCEVAELFYSKDNNINQELLGFSNAGYSETYGIASQTNIQTVDDKAYLIIRTYFGAELLYRGV